MFKSNMAFWPNQIPRLKMFKTKSHWRNTPHCTKDYTRFASAFLYFLSFDTWDEGVGLLLNVGSDGVILYSARSRTDWRVDMA
jgi:hypothetical protein